MTNCFGTTNYDYDVFGNLKKVTLPDNKIIEYKVDSQNRRVKKLINGQIKEYYLWYDQLKLAAILDENKSPKLIYIYGPESQNTPSYVIHNNTTYKILHDPGLGSVRYVIEPTTQQIVQEIEYDEFGNMMKNSNPDFQPILFSGGLYDFDTKLYRFGARDYDPTVGRWTSKDPIGFAGGDTNLYAYVGGNPMSYVDPSGFFGIVLSSEIGGILGLAGGSVSNSLVGFVFDPLNPFDSFSVIRPFDINSGTGKYGYGFEGGVGVSISVVPFAKTVEDLGGKEYGVGGSGSVIGIRGSYEAGWSPGVGPSFSAGIGIGGGYSVYGYKKDAGPKSPIKLNKCK